MTFVTATWMSARYISEVEGVEDEARVAMYSYKITSSTTKSSDSIAILEAKHIQNGTTIGSSTEMAETLDEAQPIKNYYELTIDPSTAKNIDVDVTFNMAISSEVSLKLSLMTDYNGPSGEQAAQELMIDSIAYSSTGLTGIISGTGKDTTYTIPPGNGNIIMTVKLKSSDSNFKNQYLDLIPMVVQVD